MDYDMESKQLPVITGRIRYTWESHPMSQNKLGTTSYTVSFLLFDPTIVVYS
jgi:hypothetical protein